MISREAKDLLARIDKRARPYVNDAATKFALNTEQAGEMMQDIYYYKVFNYKKLAVIISASEEDGFVLVSVSRKNSSAKQGDVKKVLRWLGFIPSSFPDATRSGNGNLYLVVYRSKP